MWLRIRSLLSDPKEIRAILLISAAVFSVTELLYWWHYLATLNGIIDKDGEPFGRDFISYWTAILLLKSGDISGLYSPAVFAATMRSLVGRTVGMFWGYPPPYLFLLWPFTYISAYKIAYAVWSGINLAAFALAVFWRTQLSASWRWIMVCSPLVFIELFIGQNGLLTSALLIGGFRLLAPTPALAGILFGLLSFKPQLGILIPFILLALRQYRAFASATLTLAVLVLLSGMTFGWQSWAGFFYDVRHLPMGAFNKMVSVSAAMRSLGWPQPVAFVLQAVVGTGFAAALCYRLRQMRDAHWTQWLLLAMPAVCLAPPYLFPYDICALGAAWILWLKQLGEKPVSALGTFAWLGLWYAPFFSESLNERGLPVTPLLLMLAFFTAWKEFRPC